MSGKIIFHVVELYYENLRIKNRMNYLNSSVITITKR